MVTIRRSLFLAGATCLVLPQAVLAGMPSASLSLTDVAEVRLQNISFFLMGFLLSALGVQLLWNYLRRDWQWLPRLSYVKALVVVGLWGMMFVLVLTMISGARELMTPGAWEKQGRTYKVAAEEKNSDENLWRHERLEKLRDALVHHAEQNGGQFPASRNIPGTSQEIWQVPHPSGMQYFYVGGTMSKESGVPLAFEPELFGGDRYVLFTNGAIGRMSNEQLTKMLDEREKR